MFKPGGFRRHPAGTCQLCDMFENVGYWGPPPGDPPPHHGYPYDDDGASEPRRTVKRTRPADSGDYSGC